MFYVKMKHSTTEFANRISRALITASNQSIPPRTWTPLLEQTLHGIHCRDSLNSSLVSRVIDPFLIHHHSLALGFFNWASQQPGFTHTSLSYQSILKSLTISRQFSIIDRLMKQVKNTKIELSPSVYRSVIGSYIACQKPLNAFSVFNDVRSMIYDIGADTCNSLLAAVTSSGNFGYAHQVFDEMLERGVRLSTLGIGVFLWRFCGTNELGKTLNLLDDVRNQNQGVNGSIIALLIVHGLCLASRVEDAMHMLDVLRKKDCKPDFMAYRVVAEALRKSGNVVEVEKVLKMKRKLGVAPRASDYRHFIFQLISERLLSEAKDLGEVIVNGKVKEAYEVLQEMKKKGLGPDISTYNHVMEACCREDMIRPAKRLWDEMFANGCEANLMTYNILIPKFSEMGQVNEAYTLFRHMLQRGVEPDVMTYDFVIKGLCQEKELETAVEVFKKSFEHDAKIAQAILGKFILYLCREGQFIDASNLVHDYTSSIGHLESNMTLLKCLADAGEVPVAIEHVKKIGEMSPHMLHDLRSELLSSLSSLSKRQPILEFIRVIEDLLQNHVVIRNLPERMY